MDRVTGDGDLGVSMRRAAEAILASVDQFPLDNIPATLNQLGHTSQRVMGGSSGPLYGVFFLRSSNILESANNTSLESWAEALHQSCLAISELGGAKVGDRTMLDALVPFAESLKSAGKTPPRQALASAIEAAERGADATAQMKPRLGRSSYLGDRVLGHPDPGAKAAAIWLRAACEALFF